MSANKEKKKIDGLIYFTIGSKFGKLGEFEYGNRYPILIHHINSFTHESSVSFKLL